MQNLCISLASIAQRESDVFLHGHRIKKRAALKENANLFADCAELTLVHSDDVLTIDPNFSRVRRHQSHEIFKQNAFAAAAPSNDRECLASCDLKIDAAQDFLLPNLFGQRSDCDHWGRMARNHTRLSGWF